MGSFSVITVFLLLLLVARGQFTTVPPHLRTTAVRTPPPSTTSTPYQSPDKRVFINLNLKLRAPSDMALPEVEAGIRTGASRIEYFLQLYYNVKSLRIVDMEQEDASEVYY